MSTTTIAPTTTIGIADALVAVGAVVVDPHLATAALQRSTSPLAPVRHAASIKDVAFFSTLPPVLLSSDYHVSSNKLFGGTQASKWKDAAYCPGKFPKSADRVVHGAAIFDHNTKTYVAVFYSTRNFGGVDDGVTLVAHVHGAPLPELESDLFDGLREVSRLEQVWLGHEMAEHTKKMRANMGAMMRAGGIATMPDFLIDGNYHLVRDSLPWLHFRSPLNDFEASKIRRALEDEIFQQEGGGALSFVPFCKTGLVDERAVNFKTVFDMAAQEPAGTLDDPKLAETLDSVLTNRGRLHAMVGVAVELLGGVSSAPSTLDLANLESIELDFAELLESNDDTSAAAADAADTLQTLTGMICNCGVVSPTQISTAATGHSSVLEKVAIATFAASDVVFAFKDLGVSRETPAMEACMKLAGRVRATQAMLVITLDNAYHIGRMTLANSVMKRDVCSPYDASRLVACPWVTIILYSEHGWFTLDCSLVQRDLLTVTEKIRETFKASPAPPPRPTAPTALTAMPESAAMSESVEELRKEMNARFDRLMTTLFDTNRIPASAPTAAAAAAPPPPPPDKDSSIMSSLRATTRTLERLTGRKRTAKDAS